MERILKNNIENIRVGIFRNGKAYTAKILSSGCGNPVYTRSFSEMVLALGYCNMINQLSQKSVERIMQMAEPA